MEFWGAVGSDEFGGLLLVLFVVAIAFDLLEGDWI